MLVEYVPIYVQNYFGDNRPYKIPRLSCAAQSVRCDVRGKEGLADLCVSQTRRGTDPPADRTIQVQVEELRRDFQLHRVVHLSHESVSYSHSEPQQRETVHMPVERL